MPHVCKNCGSSDIDNDTARGGSVCTNCGSVVEDHVIVSELEFAENSAGGASLLGQFVSGEGDRHSFAPGYRPACGKDSRQQILDRGKQTINLLGGQLKLSQHSLDTAFMFYKLAVTKRLTYGRRTIHVIGACLYLVCRTEKTPHLLIDVCDVVQVDIFSLGRTFLLLSRELCIEVPTIDPSLYIHRFAAKMRFEDKENEVAMTALRLVARMKRDWMATGRRPSGLCGAALLVAAKLHGFNRTLKDVIKIVRLSSTTIMNRLTDFSKCPSSKLTIEEFKKVDLEEEMDPPAFIRARQRTKQSQMFDALAGDINHEVLSRVTFTQRQIDVYMEKRKKIDQELSKRRQLSEEIGKKRKSRKKKTRVDNEIVSESNLKKRLTCVEHSPSHTSKVPKLDLNTSHEVDASVNDLKEIMESGLPVESLIDSQNLAADKGDQTLSDQTSGDQTLGDQTSVKQTSGDQSSVDQSSGDQTSGDQRSSDQTSGDQTSSDCLQSSKTQNDDVQGDQVQFESPTGQMEELDIEGLDDDELDDFLLTGEEIELKTKIWMEENGEFMIQLKEKEELKAQQEAEKQRKVKKHTKRTRKEKTIASSADEAIINMLSEKKLSQKINYDVLKDLTATPDRNISDGTQTSSDILSTSSLGDRLARKPSRPGLRRLSKLPRNLHSKATPNTKLSMSSQEDTKTPSKSVRFADSTSQPNKSASESGQPSSPINDQPSQNLLKTENKVGKATAFQDDDNKNAIREDEEEEDYYDEDEHENEISASQLFAKQIGNEDDDDYGYEGYGEDDTFF